MSTTGVGDAGLPAPVHLRSTAAGGGGGKEDPRSLIHLVSQPDSRSDRVFAVSGAGRSVSAGSEYSGSWIAFPPVVNHFALGKQRNGHRCIHFMSPVRIAIWRRSQCGMYVSRSLDNIQQLAMYGRISCFVTLERCSNCLGVDRFRGARSPAST